MQIGIVEFAIPCKLKEKFTHLKKYNFWLEIINDGNTRKIEKIFEYSNDYAIPVKSVQAYLLHEYNLYDMENRKIAEKHIQNTIQVAANLNAKNVVTVAGYGYADEKLIPKILNNLEEKYKRLAKIGAEYNIVISLEALGTKKTNILPYVKDVVKFTKNINSDFLKPMCDLRHAKESNENPFTTLKKYKSILSEIHISFRNKKSEKDNLNKIFKTCNLNESKKLICLESRLESKREFYNFAEYITKI